MKHTNSTGVAETRARSSILRKLLLAGAALAVALPAGAAIRYIGPAYGSFGYGGPYYYEGYPVGMHPNAGLVKLDTKDKNAEVFVNGAYAGTAGKLKSMWMRPGSYNLEVRSAGAARFTERIYVVDGKTLHVYPEARVEPKS